MRALAIELGDEGVEARLLAQAVGGRRAGGLLLQGEVHALVAAVLFGASRGDAFEPDPKAEPPDRELR